MRWGPRGTPGTYRRQGWTLPRRPSPYRSASAMPVRTAVVNPCRRARLSYLPAARPRTVKSPFASVTTLRLRPVSRFLMTTSTPGSTPPGWSLTVPERVADVICAAAGDVGVRRTTARITRNIIGDLPHDASASPDAIPLSGFETRLNRVSAAGDILHHNSDVKERASGERRRKVARRSGRQVPNRCEYANDPGQNDDTF